MAPPARKGPKGKAEELAGAEARELLDALEAGSELPQDALEKVFRLVGQPPCLPACGKNRGRADNPHCFCGLLPPPGTFRKKGLWAKEPTLELGSDPADARRQPPEAPAGLRNLGNTCYVNAALQFLHAIPDFRRALYVLEPSVAEQQIVQQLRGLFVDMHFGPRKYADPEPFANSLQLNHAIQQDGQEFLKLLLSKLEAVFAASGQQEVSSVVQRLFRGHFSYVTTCRSCGQPSEGSSRQVEFYELPLQVLQMATLQQSMVSALSPEELVGDNQYHCDLCARKCDAERQLRLRRLPPYLCLSLQRFVFDVKTFDKKKASDKMYIPVQLDLGEVLQLAGGAAGGGAAAPPTGPGGAAVLPGSPAAQYELAAVLIHKGSSASHGHYVAHVRMQDTGAWWRFDDEVAEPMGDNPTSFPGDHGTTAQAQAAAGGGGGAAAAASGAASGDEDDGAEAKGGGRKRARGGEAKGGAKRARGGAGAGGGGGKAPVARGRGGRGGRGRSGSRAPRGKGKGAAADDSDGEGGGGAKEEEATEEEQLRAALAQSAAEAQQSAAEEAQLLAVLAQSAAEGQDAQLRAALRQSMGAHPPDVEMADEVQGQQQQQGQAEEQEPQPEAAAAGGRSGRPKRGKAAAEAPGAAAAPAKRAARGKRGAAASEAAGAPVVEPAAGGGGRDGTAAAPEEQLHVVSGNAYFLVYRQRDSSAGSSSAAAAAAVKQEAEEQQQQQEEQQEQQQQQQQQQAAAGQPEAAGGAQLKAEAVESAPAPRLAPSLQQQLAGLPAAVRERVEQLHLEFEEACAQHTKAKQEALDRVAQRQEEVRAVHELLPRTDPADPGRFIPSRWLESWASSDAAPGPVDTSGLLCEHHGLSPDKAPHTFKLISSAAWDALVGGPLLSFADACRECLRARVLGLVRSDAAAELHDQALKSLERDDAGGADADVDVGFYVSKTWLQAFRRGSKAASAVPPTGGITCCHGGLAPESLSGSAKRAVISPASWSLLKQLWVTQTVRDVAAARRRTALTAARRAAAADAGGGADSDVVVEGDGDEGAGGPPASEGDVVEIESDGAGDSGGFQQARDGSPRPEQQQQQQQQQEQELGQQGRRPRRQPHGDRSEGGEGPGGVVEVLDDDDDEQQQQQQQQQQGGGGGGSGPPPAPPPKQQPAGWRLPLALDGSVKVTEEQLLAALPEFHSAHAAECQVCGEGLREAAAGHEEVRAALDAERAALAKLLSGSVQETLEEGRAYYLVPNDWLASWRAHMQAGRKQAAPALRPLPPPPLPSAMRPLLCRCHPDNPGVAVPLPAVLNRRGRMSQADPLKDALRVVSEEDWMQLLLHHSGTELEAAAEAGGDAEAAAAEAAEAAASPQSPGGRRSSRSASGGRAAGRPPQKQHRQRAAAKQQQQDLLQQRISSLAEVDPCFRGIRAVLRVAEPSTADAAQQQQQQPQPQQRQEGEAAPPPQGLAVAAGGGERAAAGPLTQAAASARLAILCGAANGHAAGDDTSELDTDPAGLVAAVAAEGGDDDWQPGSKGGRPAARGKQGGRAARAPARRGAPSASRASPASEDGSASAPAASVSHAASLRGWLETIPAPCQQHLASEEAARRAALLVYEDAELMAELVAQDELAAAASSAAAGGAERKSRRARKNRQPVRVCSGDTLARLKLKVFEALGVHPKNQRLYLRGALLEGDEATLAQLEVFPEEELRVVSTDEVPNDDYASAFDGVAADKRRRREVEQGFKDTALLGGPGGGRTDAASAPSAAAEDGQPGDGGGGGAEGAEEEDVVVA